MYGKLIDGNLHRAPSKLTIGETVVYNPTDEQLRNAGYKPVEYYDQPENTPDGQHWESSFIEQDDAIVQDWYLVDDPDDIDPSEALSIILGGANV